MGNKKMIGFVPGVATFIQLAVGLAAYIYIKILEMKDAGIDKVRDGPYYGELSDSIYSACIEKGYELEIFLSSDSSHIVANILGHRVDGAIILNSAVGKDQEEILRSQGIPTVYIDRILIDDKSASVVFDSRSGGEQAAKFLLELGHKSFMYIEGEEDNYDNNERKKGFLDALKRAGIEVKKDYILKGAFERLRAYNSVTDFLDSGKQLIRMIGGEPGELVTLKGRIIPRDSTIAKDL